MYKKKCVQQKPMSQPLAIPIGGMFAREAKRFSSTVFSANLLFSGEGKIPENIRSEQQCRSEKTVNS